LALDVGRSFGHGLKEWVYEMVFLLELFGFFHGFYRWGNISSIFYAEALLRIFCGELGGSVG
jgi:hypothetical protein